MFASNTIQAICEMVEMVKTRTIPYHPISNGLTERLNSSIISKIQKAVSEEEYDWDGHLSKLLMCYHLVVHLSKRNTAFPMTLGLFHVQLFHHSTVF